MNQKDKLLESLVTKLIESDNEQHEKTFGKWRVVVEPSKFNDSKLAAKFYDVSDELKFGPEGQYTGASYYVDDLVYGDDINKSIKDAPYLQLKLGTNWIVEKDILNQIYSWLKQFAQEPKTEGIQEDRLHQAIERFKNLGYTLYKEDSKYTALLKSGDEPVLALFYGKSSKPRFHYKFKNMEELDDYLNNYINEQNGIEQWKADRKAQRKLTKDHDIKVGDIFYTYWGYDQTNSEFYEVVNVRGSKIDLKEITNSIDTSNSGWGQDEISPVPGSYVDDVIHTVSARADGTVTNLDGESFLHLTKWNGKPISVTASGWGH